MLDPSVIIMGFLLGGLYGLIALGLSLVFGVMKLINVAHGDLVVFAAYLAYAFLTHWGIDPILSLLFIGPLMLLLGIVLQRHIFSRAYFESAEAPLIIAFGISLIIQNFHQVIWSPMSRGLTTSYSLSSLVVGDLYIPISYLLDFIASALVMLALHWFLSKTYPGKAIRAASQDPKAAKLMGINTEAIFCLAFALAMVTAAIAGIFLGLTFPFNPQSGVAFLIIAFGVVIIGGLGSMVGTFIGGVLLGLSQTLGGYYLGSAAQMLVVYLMVLLVLTIRPQGLFGVK